VTHYAKDPDALLDYSFDWSPWLDSDTISTSTWIVPAGLTIVNEGRNVAVTYVWLSAGTVGARYTVTNRVTTTGGRTDDRSLVTNVENR
jgi:hypothetical protein